jgi:hypothetical protein
MDEKSKEKGRHRLFSGADSLHTMKVESEREAAATGPPPGRLKTRRTRPPLPVLTYF